MIRRTAVTLTVLAAALASCTPTTPAPSGTAAPPTTPTGTERGLAPVAAADARALLSTLPTKGRGPKTGYARDEFGYAWMDTADGVPLSHNGCDTRNDVLKLHGHDIRYRAGSDCVITSMTLYDPYTAKTITWTKSKASSIQIDHIVPLSYAWQLGAAHWPEPKREQLANDPLNLLPVSGPANSAKRDSGPASWLPPNKKIRCAYAVRFAQVTLKYDLPVTPADKTQMLRQCEG